MFNDFYWSLIEDTCASAAFKKARQEHRNIQNIKRYFILNPHQPIHFDEIEYIINSNKETHHRYCSCYILHDSKYFFFVNKHNADVATLRGYGKTLFEGGLLSDDDLDNLAETTKRLRKMKND